MKKLFLFCMALCIFFVEGWAQNIDIERLKLLTHEFIQKANSSDALSLVTNARNYYLSLSKDGKDKMRSYYVEEITSLLENERKEDALAVINLYQNIAEPYDEKLPSLLYIKGNIYAEKMDSIRLEQTIIELNNDSFKNTSQICDYVSTLNAKLDMIREYVPPYKKLNGTWVADGLAWENGKENRINPKSYLPGPDFVLQTFYDLNADTLSLVIKPSNVSCEITNDIMVDATVFKKVKNWFPSQLIIPYASDSIYVLWCSEELNKNCPEITSFLRGTISATAAAVSAELAQKNVYSFSSQLFGGLATTATEVGLNAIISSLFTPSKCMFVLEARLKIENEFHITGTLTYKYKWVAADGSVYEDKFLNSHVSFSRWLPKSNIVFATTGFGNHIWWPIMLTSEDSLTYAKTDLLENQNTRFNYCKERIGKKVKLLSSYTCEGINALRAYNNDQYKWLMMYNDSIQRSQGYHGKFAIDNSIQPYVGFVYRGLDAKLQKKTKLTEGIYIDKVDEMGAAYVGGLKEGDVILSLNGHATREQNDIDRIISEMKLGDRWKLKVIRDKKELELLLRVTWR